MQKICLGTIIEILPNSHKYKIAYASGVTAATSDSTYIAQLCSPIPYSFGAGMKSLPQIALGTKCLFTEINNQYFIIGLPEQVGVTSTNSYADQTIEKGETGLFSAAGSMIKMMASGAIHTFTDTFAAYVIDPVQQLFFGVFKNFVLRWYSGFFKVNYDDSTGAVGWLHLDKTLDESGQPPVSQTPESVDVKFGNLGEHLVEVNTLQDYEVNTPQLTQNIKLGRNSDQVLQYNLTNDAEGVTVDTTLGTDGTTTHNIQGTNTIVITLDATNDPPLTITVNGNLQLIAGNNGISLIDGNDNTSIVSKKINLGTQDGAKEPIIMGDQLKTLLNNLGTWLNSHTHPTGTGPSGPPVQVPSLPSDISNILSTQNTTD